MKRELRARIDLSKFLQETVERVAHDRVQQHSVKHGKDGTECTDHEVVESAQQLIELVQRVRDGKRVTNEQLTKVAKV